MERTHANPGTGWAPLVDNGTVAVVDRKRADRIAAAIRELARAEGTPIAIGHVCLACAAVVEAAGVSLYLLGELGLGEPVFASGPGTERLAELQITLGEGPAIEALAQERAVLVPDLDSGGSQRRWPIYAPAAVDAGTAATFALPLTMGAISVGVLEIHRAGAGGLSSVEYADAQLFADAALSLVLERIQDAPGAGEHDLFATGLGTRWSQVHQATGMVSVQLESSLAQAFVRLRAHAFTSGRRLSEVADDVLERRLRFTRD